MQKLISTLKQKRKINANDIAVFMRQLATLIAAGIPLVASCELLEKTQEKISLRLLIYQLKKDLLSGKNFFSCLQLHTNYFDSFICQLVQIGEQSGKLDLLLNMIANQLEKKLALKQAIKRALFYPCVICIFAIAMTCMMFITVIPRFAELFRNTQVKLPLFTQSIFYLSEELEYYFSYIIFSLMVLIILFFSKHAKHIRQRLLQSVLASPFIINITKKIILTHFARQLSICLDASIPLLDALKLVANNTKYPHFAKIIVSLRYQISSGMQINQAMNCVKYFPTLMVQMVKIGEESGRLEQMLNKIADFFETETIQFLSYCQQLLEPLIMIMLGVLIGGLVIGMYLPIFKLGTVL